MLTGVTSESDRADSGKRPTIRSGNGGAEKGCLKPREKNMKEQLCLCKSSSSLMLSPGIRVKGEAFPFGAVHGVSVADEPL